MSNPIKATERQLVSEAVVSSFLGIAVPTLRTWRSRDIGPPYKKIMGAVRYDLAEVNAWAESGSKQPGGRRREVAA